MPMGYENTAGAYVATHVPDPGSILVIRSNAIILDFAETAETQAQYGTALKTAMQAMQAGDTLVTGPGMFTLEEATFTASDALWIGHGTILSPATNWNYMINVSGSNVSVNNVKIQCNSLANTLEGVAWQINGDRVRLTDCEGSGTNGSMSLPWGIEIFGDDCRLDNFLSKDAGTYNGSGGGIRVAGDRCHISNSQVLDSANRSLNIEVASGTHESLVVNNCQFVAEGTGNAQVNFNPTGTLQLAIFENVTVANIDNVAAGVSYDSTGRQQMLKFQNVDNLVLDGCRFVHGTNQGSGGRSPTLSYDDGIDKLTIRDCYLSDGITVGSGKFGTVVIENCDIGQDAGSSSYSSLIRRIDAELLIVRGNTFHLPDNTVTEVIEFSEGALMPSSTDQYQFLDNTFTANDAVTHRLAKDTELQTTPRKVIVAGNKYENLGAGSFIASSDDVVNLMLTTDRDGNLLFDDTQISAGMPDPGDGPNFFTTVPGTFVGQRIHNINWNRSGTQVTPQREWIWDGTNWTEYEYQGEWVTGSKGLTHATATTFLQLLFPAGSGVGGMIQWTCIATDGTDIQTRSGAWNFAATNKASTESVNYGADLNEAFDETQGSSTLSVAIGNFTTGNGINLAATASSSLTSPTITFYYSVRPHGSYTAANRL